MVSGTETTVPASQVPHQKRFDHAFEPGTVAEKQSCRPQAVRKEAAPAGPNPSIALYLALTSVTARKR